MDTKRKGAGAKRGKPIEKATRKTANVRRKLQVAGAELHLSNAVLDRHLPPTVKSGDVAHALAQRDTIEGKVADAAQELTVVHELLDEEMAERARLEQELAEAVQQGKKT